MLVGLYVCVHRHSVFFRIYRCVICYALVRTLIVQGVCRIYRVARALYATYYTIYSLYNIGALVGKLILKRIHALVARALAFIRSSRRSRELLAARRTAWPTLGVRRVVRAASMTCVRQQHWRPQRRDEFARAYMFAHMHRYLILYSAREWWRDEGVRKRRHDMRSRA